MYGHSLIINPSLRMYQDIHPSRAVSIDSVKINPSLIMTREWNVLTKFRQRSKVRQKCWRNQLSEAQACATLLLPVVWFQETRLQTFQTFQTFHESSSSVYGSITFFQYQLHWLGLISIGWNGLSERIDRKRSKNK